MLHLSHYTVDFKSGQFNRLKTIFLHDPDKKIPFRITHESTDKRYLTGADFDPESFQLAGGALWIGEEFGPFLIKADLNGKVLAVFDTKVDGKTVRSPDAPGVLLPGAPDAKPTAFEVKRLQGFRRHGRQQGRQQALCAARRRAVERRSQGLRKRGRQAGPARAGVRCEDASNGPAATGSTCWRPTTTRLATST